MLHIFILSISLLQLLDEKILNSAHSKPIQCLNLMVSEHKPPAQKYPGQKPRPKPPRQILLFNQA